SSTSVTHVASFLMCRPPPRATLLPYTTLFRSEVHDLPVGDLRAGLLRLVLRIEHEERVGVAVARVGDHRDRHFPVRRDLIDARQDRKSTRLNSSHVSISYAVFCFKQKNITRD